LGEHARWTTLRVDPQTILDDWQHATQGELIAAEPRYVQAARDQLAAERQIEGQHWLDATMNDVDHIIAAASQMELALPKMSRRMLARERFAKFWHDVVAHHACNLKEATLHKVLQRSRREARVGVYPDGKIMLQWDEKAGLPLYDPDDAREEAMRLSRRMVPRLMELLKRPGYRAYYLCATAPNSPRGELEHGMRAMYRRWLSLMRSCKRASRPFPIVGAVAVMESPLGRHRDWHPHLNIIVVCDGWLDYKALRARWHWNMEMRELDGHQSTIERAFREIIKYACRTVSEKSLAKSQSDDPGAGRDWVPRAIAPGAAPDHGGPGDGPAADEVSAREGAGVRPGAARPVDPAQREAPNSQTGQAPAMEEWSAVEVLEYHRAHRGFRRSRSYRELFGLPKPAPRDRSGVRYQGRLSWDGRAFAATFTLLESIPGDKSTPENIRAAIKAAWCKLLGPPGQVERALQVAKVINQHYGPVSLSV
jgi:hypothetical protein